MELYRRDLWRALLSNEIHRRPTHWRMLLLAKYCPLRKTKIKDPPQKKKAVRPIKFYRQEIV